MTCKPDTMTQQLLDLLHKEWLTPLDALRKVNCLSLAQRVSEFRHFHRWQIMQPNGKPYPAIHDKWVKLGSGKRCKAYRVQKA